MFRHSENILHANPNYTNNINHFPTKCEPSWMQDCSRISFTNEETSKECVVQKINKNTFYCLFINCENMWEEFDNKKGHYSSKSGMFFNDTIHRVQ